MLRFIRGGQHCAGDGPPPFDVIIVLGAAVWRHGQPSPALRRRVAHAVHLLHQGQGRVLLVTGGLGRHPPPEAHVMRDLALEAGVLPSHILVEDQAGSTFQSAVRCSRILRQHHWSTALIVTDRYHLPRVLLTFRSFGIRAKGSAAQGGQYSRRVWKVRSYQGREALAFVWYLGLIVMTKIRGYWTRRCSDTPLPPAPLE